MEVGGAKHGRKAKNGSLTSHAPLRSKEKTIVEAMCILYKKLKVPRTSFNEADNLKSLKKCWTKIHMF